MSDSETRHAVNSKHRVTRGKSYLFDVGTAVEYGLAAAVIIRNFQFWIERNHANGKHRHDGRTWTYCSVAALTKLFPFFTTRQIRTILDKLIRLKVLVKGRYNPKGYDRTCWYAFGDEKAFVNFDKCNSQKGQKESSPATKAIAGNDEPIPDIKQISKTDKTGFSHKGISSKKSDYEPLNPQEKEAVNLLISRGVNHSVTIDLVLNKSTPLESIRNAIQNGLARQYYSSQKGGAWRLHAGYIVAALKKARLESKIVKPTKANIKMVAMMKASKKPSTPLSQDEFKKRRQKQQSDLRNVI